MNKPTDDRKEVWKTIQEEAPDIADLMTSMAGTFGKLEGVQVSIQGKTIIDTLPPMESNHERKQRLKREKLRRYRKS